MTTLLERIKAKGEEQSGMKPVTLTEPDGSVSYDSSASGDLVSRIRAKAGGPQPSEGRTAPWGKTYGANQCDSYVKDNIGYTGKLSALPKVNVRDIRDGDVVELKDPDHWALFKGGRLHEWITDPKTGKVKGESTTRSLDSVRSRIASVRRYSGAGTAKTPAPAKQTALSPGQKSQWQGGWQFSEPQVDTRTAVAGGMGYSGGPGGGTRPQPKPAAGKTPVVRPNITQAPAAPIPQPVWKQPEMLITEPVAPEPTPILDMIPREPALTKQDMTARDKAINERMWALTKEVNSRVFPEPTKQFDENEYKYLLSRLKEPWEQEYVKRGVDEELRRQGTEPSTREGLVAGLLMAGSGINLGVGGLVSRAAAKPGLVGKAAGAVEKAIKPVAQAAQQTGKTGLAARTVERIPRGAAESVLFEAVANPSELRERALRDAALGAAGAGVLGGVMDVVGGMKPPVEATPGRATTPMPKVGEAGVTKVQEPWQITEYQFAEKPGSTIGLSDTSPERIANLESKGYTIKSRRSVDYGGFSRPELPDVGSPESPVANYAGAPAYRKNGIWYTGGDGKWYMTTDPQTAGRNNAVQAIRDGAVPPAEVVRDLGPFMPSSATTPTPAVAESRVAPWTEPQTPPMQGARMGAAPKERIVYEPQDTFGVTPDRHNPASGYGIQWDNGERAAGWAYAGDPPLTAAKVAEHAKLLGDDPSFRVLGRDDGGTMYDVTDQFRPSLTEPPGARMAETPKVEVAKPASTVVTQARPTEYRVKIYEDDRGKFWIEPWGKSPKSGKWEKMFNRVSPEFMDEYFRAEGIDLSTLPKTEVVWDAPKKKYVPRAKPSVTPVEPPVAAKPTGGAVALKAASEAKAAGKVGEAAQALDEVANAALERIKKRGNKMRENVDPFDLVDITVYAAAKIAKGAVTSADFAAHLAKQFGPEVAKRARQIWEDAVESLRKTGHDVKAYAWKAGKAKTGGPEYAGSVNLDNKLADDLNIPPRRTGGFTVERGGPMKGRDFDARDKLLQPLGIYGPEGEIIQKGSYDRLGEIVKPDGKTVNVGSQAGRRLAEAQQAIQDQTLAANKKIDRIVELVDSTIRKPAVFGKGAARAKGFADFVDLAERYFDDPVRVRAKQSNTPIGEALRLHDELTEGFRKYIIDSRKELNIPTPDNWGITEKGYFRHLFLGDIRIFKDGNFIGTAKTYSEAQKMALDILKAEPSANIRAIARNTWGGDPTVRVSTRKYFRLVNEIAGEVELSQSDIMADLRGIVGRKAAKQKWAGYVQHREGARGYEKAYSDVMRIHAAQVYRTQELSKMNRAVQPMVESLRKYGKPGLADEIEAHITDLWGTPSKFEKDFGRLIAQTPVLRNYVGSPAMALRQLARRITGLNFALKLKLSPRSALINRLQPFATLWPYIKTSDFAKLSAEVELPKTRKWLMERGVLETGSKLETTGSAVRQKIGSEANPMNWFQNASAANRAMGYLFGYKRAIGRGLNEAAAHQSGLAWAQKVEFDNSTWNIQPLLRSPGGRVLGQFKSFAGKNLENVREVMTADDISRAQRAGRVAKWAGSQVAIGGAKAFGVVTEVLGGYALVQYLSKQMQSYGMKKDEADKLAEAVYYGAPSLIGQDLSASVMILEAPYGNSPLEKAANFTFGPTGTAVIKGTAAVAKGDYLSAAKTVSAPIAKAYEIGTQVAAGAREGTDVNIGRGQSLPINRFETVMRALGFTPLKQSRVYDMRDADIGTAKEFAEMLKLKPDSVELKTFANLGVKVGTLSNRFESGDTVKKLKPEEFDKYQRETYEAIAKAIRVWSQSPRGATKEAKRASLEAQISAARAKVREKYKAILKLPAKSGRSRSRSGVGGIR